MKAVQFGAGNIGKGFIGRLLSRSGWEIVFVDAIPVVVNELNRRGGYQINIVGERSWTEKVERVRSLHISEDERIGDEVCSADLIGVSVGVRNLPAVAEVLAPALLRRVRTVETPVDVLVLENLIKAGSELKKLVLEHCGEEGGLVERKIGFVPTVVAMMVPVVPGEIKRKDPLYVAVEDFSELPCERTSFKGRLPSIEGLIFYDDLTPIARRKLFLHNSAHAVCGYIGYLKGYRYVWEAMEDQELFRKVSGGMWESGRALIHHYDFREEEMTDYIEDLLRRFRNRPLNDEITRVARDPMRKLRPEDRLVGPAKLALSCGVRPLNLSLAIACALKYDYAEDESAMRLQSIIKEKGYDEALSEICGIRAGEELYELVMEALG